MMGVTADLNVFLEKEINSCFRCSSKKYETFYFIGRIYKLCKKCRKNKDVIRFFNGELSNG